MSLTVSVTVWLEALVGGPLSGASMNPARLPAPALLSGNFTAAWVYVAAPLAGVLLAACCSPSPPPRAQLRPEWGARPGLRGPRQPGRASGPGQPSPTCPQGGC